MRHDNKIHGGLLAKNTVLNLIGQIVPLIIAFVAIPYTVHNLGTGRFGVLSLALVVLGYFSLFEMGLGRATTKFVAELLGKGEIERIYKTIWTSLIAQTVLGVIGGAALAASTPILVRHILKTPPDLTGETEISFYILAMAVPVVVCSRNIRAVLEARQRFELINAVQIPSSCLTYIIPVIGIFLGFRLPGILLLLTVSRTVTAVAYLLMCFRLFPKLSQSFGFDVKVMLPLLAFGGWVTVCNVIIPLLVYLDRFLIGALAAVNDLTYYTVPYDLVSRLLIFPGALGITLFPAFSMLSSGKIEELRRLYARSLKYVLLTVGPLALLTVFFARPLLEIWLGAEFAAKGTLVLQILAVGMLLNALSQMPANLLDGIGRVDMRAKIFLLYVGPYIVLLWYLIKHFGIAGAATAWLLRGAIELGLFFIVTWRSVRFRPEVFLSNGILKGIVTFVCLASLLSGMMMTKCQSILIQGLVAGICLVIFEVAVWRYALENVEKDSLKAMFLLKKQGV